MINMTIVTNVPGFDAPPVRPLPDALSFDAPPRLALLFALLLELPLPAFALLLS